MNSLKKIHSKAPYLYFIMIWSGITLAHGFNGRLQMAAGFLFCIPFVYQWIYEKKHVNLLLGILMVMWSMLIFFAYLSDLAAIDTFDARAWRFIGWGALLTPLNFWMSVRLLAKARISKTNQEETAGVTAA